MSRKIFSNNLVAIYKSKFVLKLNKPEYIGTCIEFSKVLLYLFYYDYIESKYNNKSKQLFTDTDNFMYESKTEDIYEQFSSNKEMLDFISYLTNSKYYDNSDILVIEKNEALQFKNLFE